MPNKTNFQRNLLIGSGASLILLIISGIASIISIQNLLYSSKMVAHTNNVIRIVDSCTNALVDAETGQRGYLLTGATDFLDPYRESAGRISSLISHLREETGDNHDQQVTIGTFQRAVEKRLSFMQVSISDRAAGRELQTSLLLQGRLLMEEARRYGKEIKDRETALLEQRTARLNTFANYAPVFIFLASLLGLAITSVFYFRIRSEYAKSTALRESLAAKDADITRRINLVQGIAGQIAQGDYSTRVPEEGADGLGALSASLNNMAAALEKAFRELERKEWAQSGTALIAEEMLGEKTLERLCSDVLASVARYTGSLTGAVYLCMPDGSLRPVSGFGVLPERMETLQAGEGLAGQAVHSGAVVATSAVPADYLSLGIAGGNIRPSYLLAAPILHEGAVHAVLELGSVDQFGDDVRTWLRESLPAVGIGMNTAVNRSRLQTLLQETQAQTEELQTQQEELENLNAELEAQTARLQASEEELRVQQEELVQANGELNERAAMLEERNQLIAERNIEIQKRSEELALSSKYKSEFLANMSHELRTPLNSILLLSRLLGDNAGGNLTPEQVEYTTVIRSSGQGLLALIDDILDLSKIEAGRMEMDWETVAVSSVAEQMKGLFAPLAAEKGLDFHIDVRPEAQTVIRTDHQRLSQILRNLLSNAFKFTTKGSVTLRIAPGRTPDLAVISVKDTGIGIPSDKQALIFEAFQQADGSTQRSYGGTGLGLSISRELSRLLGGVLEVSSVPGEGSTFTLTIPVAGATVGEHLPATPETAAEALPPLPPPAKSARMAAETPTYIPPAIPDDRDAADKGKGVILIVEDDTAFAQSLLDYTRSRGYTGVVTVRGDEALPLATTHQPTAILLDIRLPVKNGWEVMEELKTNSATRHIPVHMMSASSESRLESIQHGAVDFMPKPLAFEEMSKMFGRLEQVLKRHPKKVLIVEENKKHAEALSTFLSGYGVTSHTADSVKESVAMLQSGDVDCVVLDMGVPNATAYETLEQAKQAPGLENLPIIVFTGRSLSRTEAERIRKYADTVVLKTAHSYRRLLDEVSLFLHLMEEQKRPARPAGSAESGQSIGRKDVLQGKTVLVADDDVRNIFSLTKALEQHGVQVVSATDGREALEVLAANPKTDLVLMDMMMPEMDGYESIRQIRKSPKTKGLPVIAVTAKTMLGDREKCIEAGASDYISKPVDLDQLLSLLRVWLYDSTS